MNLEVIRNYNSFWNELFKQQICCLFFLPIFFMIQPILLQPLSRLLRPLIPPKEQEKELRVWGKA